MKGLWFLIIFLSTTLALAQRFPSQVKTVSKTTSDTAKLVKAHSFGISNRVTLGHPNKATENEVEKKSEPLVAVLPAQVQNAPQIVEASEKVEANRSVSQDENDLNGLGEEYAGKTPRFFGLIIGISQYKEEGPELPSLDYPTKDASRLKQVLIDRYGFEASNIRYLENPVRATIIDAFEQLSSELKAEDNLLIFYAGHGYYDKERKFGYWLPADAKVNGKSEWISNTTVRDYLGVIHAKHTLLISDACFGGSIFKSRGVMGNMIQKIGEMYRYPSRRAMTSGNLSLVPDKSFFADFLIKRLNDNADTFLPSQTLFYRIYEPVSNNSPATPQFGVVQETGDEGGDFIFIRKGKK